jgi:hypothetical protein
MFRRRADDPSRSIIITDELAHRHSAAPNYLREKLAFRDLADDQASVAVQKSASLMPWARHADF